MKNYFTRYDNYLSTIANIQSHLSSKGYLRTHIPLVDKQSNYNFLENSLSKNHNSGNETLREQYVVLMDKENKVIRFDSTVSLAQLLRKHNTVLPFKAQYANTVLHKRGPFNETWQLGAEHFYSALTDADKAFPEMLEILCESINILGIQDFFIHIGYVPLVHSLFERNNDIIADQSKIYAYIRNRSFDALYRHYGFNEKGISIQAFHHLFKIVDKNTINEWYATLNQSEIPNYYHAHNSLDWHTIEKKYFDPIRSLFSTRLGFRLRLDLSEVPETSFHYGTLFSAYAILGTHADRPICIARGGNYIFDYDDISTSANPSHLETLKIPTDKGSKKNSKENSQKDNKKPTIPTTIAGMGFTLYPDPLLELTHDH